MKVLRRLYHLTKHFKCQPTTTTSLRVQTTHSKLPTLINIVVVEAATAGLVMVEAEDTQLEVEAFISKSLKPATPLKEIPQHGQPLKSVAASVTILSSVTDALTYLTRVKNYPQPWQHFMLPTIPLPFNNLIMVLSGILTLLQRLISPTLNRISRQLNHIMVMTR